MNKTILLLLIPALILLSTVVNGFGSLEEPQRPEGQMHMLGFAADPIETVRIGLIGVGMRGTEAIERFCHIEGTEIRAICDLESPNLENAQRILRRHGLQPATEYGIEFDVWKRLCERDDIDLIYITTDWLTHTPMAVYAMEQGKHVAVEVPAATTVEECWQLVNTSERTRKHCIMLENCCYDFFELATLNMAQHGLFGEIVYAEGAYIHDLRSLIFNERRCSPLTDEQDSQLSGYWNQWRKEYNQHHTGNPYPTHGLGPVCLLLDIHRGDRMEYLVSVSSGQFGLREYARERFGEGSPEATQEYMLGDMNTSVIRTAKGRTIMIQHNVTNPRPYSRLHVIGGTRGFAQKYPVQQIAFDPLGEHSLSVNEIDSMLLAYEFPFVSELKDDALRVGGHGGMDYIMDSRLIYCLRNGLALDMDVYDAAEWSCLVELTERSVMNGGAPVAIPDFTRGSWQHLKGYRHAYAVEPQ